MYFLKSPKVGKKAELLICPSFRTSMSTKDLWQCYVGRKEKVPHGMILTYRSAEMSSSLSEKHCHKRNAGPSALFLHKGTTMFYLSWVSVGVCGIELDHRYLLSTLGLGTLSPCETCNWSTFPCVGVPGFFQVSPVMCLTQDVWQLVSNVFHVSNLKVSRENWNKLTKCVLVTFLTPIEVTRHFYLKENSIT